MWWYFISDFIVPGVEIQSQELQKYTKFAIFKTFIDNINNIINLLVNNFKATIKVIVDFEQR